jgi:hypothetical protein
MPTPMRSGRWTALRTPFSSSLETFLLPRRVLSSFILFLNTPSHISHPFVPATTTNKQAALPSPHRVFLPLLTCYQITPYIYMSLASSSPLTRSCSFPKVPSQVVLFPPRAKGPRSLVLPCLPIVRIYCRWALSFSHRASLQLFGDNCLLAACLFFRHCVLVVALCRFSNVWYISSAHARSVPYSLVSTTTPTHHPFDFVPKLRCARTIIVLAFGTFASWVILVSL